MKIILEDWAPITTFFVPGIVAPQGSKDFKGMRVSKSTGKAHAVLVESSKALPEWRESVILIGRHAHRPHPPIDAPVVVVVTFYRKSPKRPQFDYPAVAPDTDKLQRAIGDALEKAGILRNDSRIVTWVAQEEYAKPGDKIGAQIEVGLR